MRFQWLSTNTRDSLIRRGPCHTFVATIKIVMMSWKNFTPKENRNRFTSREEKNAGNCRQKFNDPVRLDLKKKHATLCFEDKITTVNRFTQTIQASAVHDRNLFKFFLVINKTSLPCAIDENLEKISNRLYQFICFCLFVHARLTKSWAINPLDIKRWVARGSCRPTDWRLKTLGNLRGCSWAPG